MKALGGKKAQWKGAHWIAASALAICCTATPAHAVPFVDVTAFWTMRAVRPLVPGVEITCIGNATGSGGICGDTVSLDTTVTSSRSLSASSSGGFEFTNVSGGPLSGLFGFTVDRSAFFNTRRTEIAISLDDPDTQSGAFNSTVSLVGPALAPSGQVSDRHSCSVGFMGESGSIFSPTTCGVHTPDSSETLFFLDLGDLSPGASVVTNATLSITADFVLQAIPEPSSLAILLMSMSALGAIRFVSRSAGTAAPS
jgi:hypothetical protein